MTDAIGGTSFLAGAQGADLPRPGEFRQAILDSASKALGMSTQDVQTALQGGQSLADLAQQKGVATDDLVGAVASALQPLGSSDSSQTAQRIVDHKGGFGGHHHHHAQAANPADGTSDSTSTSSSTSPFEVLSQALGMSQSDLLQQLESGTSLNDLLSQNGLTQQSLSGLLDTTA